VQTLPVTRLLDNSGSWSPVWNLNELEWDAATNTILANVWQTNDIVRIRLEDGKVTHQYDMTQLSRPASADVLNGIASVWDSTTAGGNDEVQNQFWITGKLWTDMYRIRFLD
jgi:glutamine cyclotransferase